MITLTLIILLAILLGVILFTLSDLALLTIAILALEKLFCRLKKRYDRTKKK